MNAQMNRHAPALVFQFPDERDARKAMETFGELGYDPEWHDRDAPQPQVSIRVIGEDLTSALEIGQACGGQLLSEQPRPHAARDEEEVYAMAYELNRRPERDTAAHEQDDWADGSADAAEEQDAWSEGAAEAVTGSDDWAEAEAAAKPESSSERRQRHAAKRAEAADSSADPDRLDRTGPEPEIPGSDEGPLYDVSADTYDHFSGDVRA
jgi:hypothetical protein